MNENRHTFFTGFRIVIDQGNAQGLEVFYGCLQVFDLQCRHIDTLTLFFQKTGNRALSFFERFKKLDDCIADLYHGVFYTHFRQGAGLERFNTKIVSVRL